MLRIFAFLLCLVDCLSWPGSRMHPSIPSHRIIGGTKSRITDHPYQLSLQTTNHICGASILNETWIITAAHCIGNRTRKYRVSAGSSSNRQGTLYNVTRIILHPNYEARTFDYDVALLEIAEKIKLNNRSVKPVRLARQDLTPGTMVNVTGWGSTKEGGVMSDGLMRVTIPIVDRKQCFEAYRRYRGITDRMICAGYINEGGKDSCQGDSGGALTVGDVLYGIVSWGQGCARPDYPGVYTNIINVRSWITSAIGL